jgi:hypothetical protein
MPRSPQERRCTREVDWLCAKSVMYSMKSDKSPKVALGGRRSAYAEFSVYVNRFPTRG